MGRGPGTVCLWEVDQDFSPSASFFCYLWEFFARVISIKAFGIYSSPPESRKQTDLSRCFFLLGLDHAWKALGP